MHKRNADIARTGRWMTALTQRGALVMGLDEEGGTGVVGGRGVGAEHESGRELGSYVHGVGSSGVS